MINSEEIKEMIENRIQEKKKEVRPDLFNQVYVEQITTELETLESVLAEISDMERRKELVKHQK